MAGHSTDIIRLVDVTGREIDDRIMPDPQNFYVTDEEEPRVFIAVKNIQEDARGLSNDYRWLELTTPGGDGADYDDYLMLGGESTMQGPLDMGRNLIENVTNPKKAQDGATKYYVDKTVDDTVNTKMSSMFGTIYPVGTVVSNMSESSIDIPLGMWSNIGSMTVGESTIYYWERTA